jgi:hypothetical protein
MPLLVATGGYAIDSLADLAFGADGEHRPHLSQAWQPVRCPCGQVHAPEEPGWFTVVAGPGQEDLAIAEDTPTFAVVPHDGAPVAGHAGALRAGAEVDFARWSRDAVAHLLHPVLTPGLIGLSFSDVRAVLMLAGTAGFDVIEGRGRAEALVRALTGRGRWGATRAGVRAALVGVSGGPRMRLRQVDEACKAVVARVGEDAEVIFYAFVDPRLGAGELRIAASMGA